jgi:hypothetical protein
MRWGRKHEVGDAAEAEPVREYWTSRLAGIGFQLDSTRTPLSGLAISLTGDEAAISVLELGSSHYRSGWRPVDAAVGESPARPYGHNPGALERQLAQIGRLLDADERNVADPCVIELHGGYLVTALADIDGTRQLTSWSILKEKTAL